MSIHTPRKRSTHRPSSFSHRTQLRITSNGVFALGILAGAAIALLVMMFLLSFSDTVREGERVCVEYIDADGYFCGPVVFTDHDVFRG